MLISRGFETTLKPLSVKAMASKFGQYDQQEVPIKFILTDIIKLVYVILKSSYNFL